MIDHHREEGDNKGRKKGWGQKASKHSTKRSKLVDGKRQIQIPNKWTLMSGCSQPEVCCRECTLAMNGLDTKSGNKRLQAANQTKGHSFLGSCFPMNPGRQTRDKVHKTQLTSQPTCPFVPTTGQKVPTSYILSRLGRTSFLLRASPMVLPM